MNPTPTKSELDALAAEDEERAVGYRHVNSVVADKFVPRAFALRQAADPKPAANIDDIADRIIGGLMDDGTIESHEHKTLPALAKVKRILLKHLPGAPPAASDAYAAGEAAGIERGWPAEPTPEMLDAAQAAQGGFSNQHIAAHYRAMRAAALRSLKPEGAPPVDRVQPGDGWLEIASAPKDGTPILIAWLTGPEGYPAGQRRMAVDKAWWAGAWCPDRRSPTAWQPLPAPPAGKGG